MIVIPKKALGQHFLVDDNILGVIGRLAEVEPDDVILEIGPGHGVLTTFLADRARLVHAIELDSSLEPDLRGRLRDRSDVDLVFGDALTLDLASLSPAPTKLVANLPYNVATPIVVESLDGLPAIELWCVMVQREVADRLFAEPGTKAYGAVSVLVRLSARRTGFHAVSREVFRPRPNVDSALVAFRRVPPPDSFATVKRLVTAAFAHRRKTLANSLALAGYASRPRAVAALEEVGRAPTVRAEQLRPGEFLDLARALGAGDELAHNRHSV
jgi:16S rRNA (adenine1518-N6/adenine1519-N6)-dimethyltransferase